MPAQMGDLNQRFVDAIRGATTGAAVAVLARP
jgi:hypothetical protein